jgi:DNA-binding CsgD family transcriptional regulator
MLVGREAEQAAIASLCEGARAGVGGALVVRGVAGSGKSTLLADAREAAGVERDGVPMRVLVTSGVESESPLAFAALQRLLWPLRSRIAQLPGPQRGALRGALGEGVGSRDRFLVFLATLSLLADAGESQPLLVVVDDAQWLDEASGAALLFVARRLQAEPVALLFAARDGAGEEFDAGDLRSVTLGAVSEDAAARLIAARAGVRPDPAVLADILAASGGNPLALVELAGVLTADQLTAAAPLPTPLPLTGGVERAFSDRHRRLSEAAQRLLLVAAADDTARLSVIRDASQRLGAGDSALEEVERAGMLRVQRDTVALYHPLVRSAVYGSVTTAERRAAHRALAEVLAGDPDRRAWHLAAAADRADESVVAALDGVAERAAGRGGHEAASAAWARAAELTAASEPRGRRLVAAATSAWLAGQPTRGAALAAAATPDVDDPQLRAELLTLQGQIEWNTRSLDEGYDLILQAAQSASVAEGVGGRQTRQLAMLAASLAAFGAHSPRVVDLTTLAGAPAYDALPTARAADRLLHGFLAITRHDWPAAAACIREAWRIADAEPLESDAGVVSANLAIAALHLGDDARGLRLHAGQLTAARGSGALNMAEHALTRGALFQIATGAWGEAAAAADEALPLASSSGQPGLTALPTAQLAVIAALQGDAQAADRHLEEATGLLNRHAIGITRGLASDLTQWARGLRAPQPAAAVPHFEQMSTGALQRTAALDRLEAAVRGDRLDLARQWLDELAAFAEGTGIASAVAAVQHGHALLCNDAAAEDHYRAALAAHEESLRLPDRARTELAYGEWLRRARRRVDARAHLRTALTAFEALGATRWAERAAQELRASGETARRRDVSTGTELTAQERQVVALVRQGLSNRDAAAQLFVSPRTVDFHLRNVYSKLGVSSRAQLAALSLT